jgi:hypothetical protein
MFRRLTAVSEPASLPRGPGRRGLDPLSGHCANFDNPDFFNNTVIDWLDRTAASDGIGRGSTPTLDPG